MGVETTSDDLFRKIGALTVENEVLHREIERLRVRVEELEGLVSHATQDEEAAS